jgi:FkbM family methyltransferase
MNLSQQLKARIFAAYLKRKYVRKLTSIGAQVDKQRGSINIRLGDVLLKAKTEDDLFIAVEIFYHRCYNFETQKQCVVYDVGMNVAFASLFFASKENVQKVYSFELFKPTYDLAVENLKLNPSLYEKIVAYNFGLGAENSSAELEYSAERKGSMGINGLPQNLTQRSSAVTVPVQFKGTTETILPLIEKNAEFAHVLKIDTEGSEYQIIQNLNKSGLLKKFDIVMLEWHQKDPVEIITALQENKFGVFNVSNEGKGGGMIYAGK